MKNRAVHMSNTYFYFKYKHNEHNDDRTITSIILMTFLDKLAYNLNTLFLSGAILNTILTYTVKHKS